MRLEMSLFLPFDASRLKPHSSLQEAPMVRILIVVMSLFSAHAFAQFSDCMPGDKKLDTVATQSVKSCTAQAYCTKYDDKPFENWNYRQKYFGVHQSCNGDQVCTGYDIKCQSKSSGVVYYAYKQYACGKCIPNGKDW